MNAYNSQRVGAGTVALGIATGAYELAVDFAKEREQFGRPIAEFQGLHWMLADMSTRLEAARSLTYRAAASHGPNGSPFPDPTLAAQAKIFTAEDLDSGGRVTHCRRSGRPGTHVAIRSRGCTATCGCSPSAVVRRRSSERSSRREFWT